jgi:hypothetical protein
VSELWGIPAFLPGKLSDLVPSSTYAGGVLCFYVDDYRFDAFRAARTD